MRTGFLESNPSSFSELECSWHIEKAQKFKVLTGRVYKSHGFGRGTVASSAGKIVESVGSSEARNCHILRLLSRP
jgi:hypothetical protein